MITEALIAERGGDVLVPETASIRFNAETKTSPPLICLCCAIYLRNPKSEIRNPKQIQKTENLQYLKPAGRSGFGHFVFELGFVSGFDFRTSDLASFGPVVLSRCAFIGAGTSSSLRLPQFASTRRRRRLRPDFVVFMSWPYDLRAN